MVIYLPHHLPIDDQLQRTLEVRPALTRTNTLRSTAAALRNHGSGILEYFNNAKQFRISLRLHALLQNAFRFNSSDPRDMVYAFVGLADPSYDIKPDYNQSNQIQNVLVNATMRIICVEENLDVLRDVSSRRAVSSFHKQDELHTSLPSWVPDWTKAPTEKVGPARISNSNPFYRPGPPLLVGKDTTFRPVFEKLGVSPNQMAMKVRGVCVTYCSGDTELRGISLWALAVQVQNERKIRGSGIASSHGCEGWRRNLDAGQNFRFCRASQHR